MHSLTGCTKEKLVWEVKLLVGKKKLWDDYSKNNDFCDISQLINRSVESFLDNVYIIKNVIYLILLNIFRWLVRRKNKTPNSQSLNVGP